MKGGAEEEGIYRTVGRQPQPHEWPQFLQSYRLGRWDGRDWSTSSSSSSSSNGSTSATTTLTNTTAASSRAKVTSLSEEDEEEGNDDTTGEVLFEGEKYRSFDFFESHGFLAAPRPTKRVERLIHATLLHHGLAEPTKNDDLKLYCEMAKRIFHVDVALFTMSCADQSVVSVMGQCESAGIVESCIPSAYALCSHGFLLPSDAAFVVADRRDDWRTRGFIQRNVHGAEMRFYASVPLLLTCPPTGHLQASYIKHGVTSAAISSSSSCSTTTSLRKVHAGNLIIMREKPWHDFGVEQTGMLHDMASMAAKTIEVDTLNSKQHKAVDYQEGSAALARALQPSISSSTTESTEDEPVSISMTASSREVESNVHVEEQQQRIFVDLLAGLLQASQVVIVDLVRNSSVMKRKVDAHLADRLVTSEALKRLSKRRRNQLVSWCQGVDEDRDADALLALLPTDPRTRSYVALPIQSEGIDIVVLICWSFERVLDDTDAEFVFTAGVLLHNVFLRQQALLAQRTQLRFIRSVQHEMRTPLNCILGYLELLSEQAQLSPSLTFSPSSPAPSATISPSMQDSKAKELLEAVRLSSLDLKGLVDSVLDLEGGSMTGLAKVTKSAGQMNLPVKAQENGAVIKEKGEEEEEPCNLGSLLETVCQSESDRIGQLQRQDLRMFDDARPLHQLPLVLLDVAPEAQDWTVTQPSQVRRILASFLSNALRFTPGHGLVRVDVNTATGVDEEEEEEVSSSSVEVRIQDSGVGMTPDFVESGYLAAFEKASAFTAGAGVGATVGAKLVEQLRGKFAVSSSPGQGTTVSFTLPCRSSNSSVDDRGIVAENLSSLRYCFVVEEESPDTPSELKQAAEEHIDRQMARLGLSKSTSASEADLAVVIDGLHVDESSQQATVTDESDTPIIVLRRSSIVTSTATMIRDQNNIVLTAPFGPLALKAALLAALARRCQAAATAVTTAPAAAAAAAAAPNRSPILKPVVDRPSNSLPRILLVEDNPINMRLLTVIVSKLGYEFAEAVDGLDAVEKYHQFRPHVVLLDISLPHLDGFEVCRRMRKVDFGYRPLIVATTALSAQADQRRGLDVCGMDHWRTKPLSPRALRADLAIWIAPFLSSSSPSSPDLTP